jgi:replicative DNA helicase
MAAPTVPGRIPPQDLDAERAVLAAMLLSREAIGDAIDFLRPEDFYRESHERVFRAILSLYDRNEPTDLISLRDELARTESLEKVGGVSYLAEFFEYTVTAANVKHHAKIAREKAILRALILTSTEIAAEAYDPTNEVQELLGKAEQKIFELAEGRISKNFEQVREWVRPTMESFLDLKENHRHITGVESGFADIDRLTAGWQRSDLVVIAARPSMGKTALCLNFAAHVALELNQPVAIFSLEMSAQQLTQRLLCSEAKVNMHDARTGKIRDAQVQRLTHAASRLTRAPIYIDDTPGVTVLQMRAKARRLKGQVGLAMVVVDYLQLMQSDARVENRQQEIAAVSRGLKSLAKELDVPVVTGSQLSRAIETRTDRRPLLSDLRESGAIEQDADIVAFIHRPEYYQKDKPELENFAELIVGKHRNGPTDTVNLTFVKEYARFESWSPRYEGIEADLPH